MSYPLYRYLATIVLECRITMEFRGKHTLDLFCRAIISVQCNVPHDLVNWIAYKHTLYIIVSVFNSVSNRLSFSSSIPADFKDLLRESCRSFHAPPALLPAPSRPAGQPPSPLHSHQVASNVRSLTRMLLVMLTSLTPPPQGRCWSVLFTPTS